MEASRLVQGTIKSSLDDFKGGSNEKLQPNKTMIRNLHVLCLFYTGDLRCICGAPEDASRAYHEVLHQVGSEGNLYLMTVASLRMFKAYFMRCEWNKAMDHLKNAQKSSDQFQNEGSSCSWSEKIIEAEILVFHGSHNISMNKSKDAVRYLQKALEILSVVTIQNVESETCLAADQTNLARRVLVSQVSYIKSVARLQLAEAHVLRKEFEEAEDALKNFTFESPQGAKETAGLKSTFLFITAILKILRNDEFYSDLCTTRFLQQDEEGMDSARCHLRFEDRLDAVLDNELNEVILNTLLEAYKESKGIPILSYKVAQLVSLLLLPTDPLEASVFVHDSIGISYQLQSMYITRTAYLQDGFAKGRGEVSDQSAPAALNIFENLPVKLADLRKENRQFTDLFGIVPEEVVVCSLSVTTPADILNVSDVPVLTCTRTRARMSSIAVKIPLKGDRNRTTQSSLGNTSFLSDLSTILAKSNASMKQSWDFNDKRQTKKWWTTRLKLDQELESLLKDVECNILGPLSLFLLGEATSKVDILVSHVQSICSPLEIPQDAVEALTLVLLHAKSYTEKEICIQIKTVLQLSRALEREPSLKELESMSETFKAVGSELPPVHAFNPGPVILVLDGQCQPFPWESLPIFKRQEYYRVPSLSYIHGVYSKVKKETATGRPGDGVTVSEEVNWDSAYFLLNPSGDLTSTQRCFEDWFIQQQGWPGTSGEVPETSALLEMLSLKDIFLYFGHGTCEQYISKAMVENLKSCSAVFLMGCSSAKLSNNYMNQGRGFLLSYLLAGSPLAIGNLWDVTDKDIDRFAKAVLENCLQEEYADSDKPFTALSIIKAREACKLHSLTGSAPVYYGLPAVLARAWRTNL